MAQWSAVTANARELALPLLKPPLVDLGSNRVLKTQNRLFVLISLHSRCNPPTKLQSMIMPILALSQLCYQQKLITSPSPNA